MQVGRALVPAIALMIVSGCDRGGSPPTVVVLSISKQTGDQQSAPAGSVLPLPLQVIVRNAADEPVPGARVRFRSANGSDVQLSDTIIASLFDGVARVTVRLGAQAGANQTIAQASIIGQSDQVVTFSATVTAAPTLDAISKSTVQGGDTVLLSGTGFAGDLAGNAAFFGSALATVLGAPSSGQLLVVVPACLTPGAEDAHVAVGSASTNTRPVTYVASTQTVALDGSSPITVGASELGTCLRLSADAATYLVVPQFATGAGPLDTAQFVLGSAGSSPIKSADALSAPGTDTRTDMRGSYPVAFEATLRRLEHALVPKAIADRASRAAQQGARRFGVERLEVGGTRSFQVLSSLTSATLQFQTVTATLRYSGENVYIYVDNNTPAGFTDAQIAPIGQLFDHDLYAIDERTFGAESDIDGNGRVIVLLSPVINALTPTGACQVQGFVTGFFFGNDLTAAAHSNRGEIFYALVPDPAGTFSCAHSVSAVTAATPSTFIHEFQHMISFNQHVLVRGGSDETTWLNEGLSHIAEEMGSRFYESRYPAPAGRTDPTQLFPDSATSFIRGDLSNSYQYLLSPETVSLTLFASGGTLPERGAAWLFLRWLGDQKDSTIYSKLVQTSRTGTDNVERASGESFDVLFGDWSIALYADSLLGVARSATPSRYRYLSRNLRAIYEDQFERNPFDSRFPRSFPIVPRTLPFNGASSRQSRMVPGTMSFYRLPAPPSTGIALRFTRPDGSTFDASRRAQVGILRLPPNP